MALLLLGAVLLDPRVVRDEEVASLVEVVDLVLEDLKEGKRTKAGQLEVLEDKIDNLHKTCDFLVSHYAGIKADRTKEEEGLKTAKTVLQGAKVGFLQH